MPTTQVNKKAWRVIWLGPLLCIYVLPSDPVPEDSGHTVLSVLVQEIPLQDSYLKWPCRSLRFSRFWHTEFRIDLGPVTVIFMHWTRDHFCACGFMITDTTAHSTGTTLPLSPVSRSKVPIHTNPHLSESPSRAKRKACCNMKHEYENVSRDSDITMGNKARRQICSLSRYPRISNVHLLKLHLHSFWSYLFLRTRCAYFPARYQNEDKNDNGLIASLESLYIFGALKKRRKVKALLVTEGLTQTQEVVKNSIRGLYTQQLEIRTLCNFFVVSEKNGKMFGKCKQMTWAMLGLTGSERVSHSQVRPTASWGHTVGLVGRRC